MTKWTPVSKVNDYIYTGAPVRVKATGVSGQVEDMFRRQNNGKTEYRVQVKLFKHRYTKPFTPDEIERL